MLLGQSPGVGESAESQIVGSGDGENTNVEEQVVLSSMTSVDVASESAHIGGSCDGEQAEVEEQGALLVAVVAQRAGPSGVEVEEQVAQSDRVMGDMVSVLPTRSVREHVTRWEQWSSNPA